MKKEWRIFFKGDLVYVDGFSKVKELSMIPAFVYESQRMKDIISIYAFGLFDEHSSSYIKDTVKAKNVAEWLRACEKQGYSKDYVIEKMKLFKIKAYTINSIKVIR